MNLSFYGFSGVKKIKKLQIYFFISIIVLFFYLSFSTFLTPFALNKSRSLLSKDGFNSFLPTIRVQQFSDSFQGFTFLVQNRVDNEIENVFIHDKSNVLKNLTTNQSKTKQLLLLQKKRLVQEKKMILLMDLFYQQILKM